MITMRSLSFFLITSSSLAAGADMTSYTNTGYATRDDKVQPEEPVASPEGCLLESIMSNWQNDRKVEYCFDLKNDMENVVGGKFCIMGRIETELKVRVEAAEGYRLLKNHIWVGDNLQNVPMKSNGRDVDVLKFPETGCDSNAEMTNAIWTIHENHNPCERNVATKDFYALGKMVVEHMETGTTTTVYPSEHDANDDSPLPWVDVTLWCGCDGFYVRRRNRNLRGLSETSSSEEEWGSHSFDTAETVMDKKTMKAVEGISDDPDFVRSDDTGDDRRLQSSGDDNSGSPEEDSGSFSDESKEYYAEQDAELLKKTLGSLATSP